MDKDLIIGDVLQELAGTRRMLEKLTQEHMTWKPHEKSMSLGGLSTHLVNLLNWQSAILLHSEFDFCAISTRSAGEPRRGSARVRYGRSQD
jgi:hypothetical protein